MPGLPAARAWGDGKTTRRRHIIATMSYTAAYSWLTCATDGESMGADTPELLEVLWARHGGKLLDMESEERRPMDQLEAQQRGIEAIALVHKFGRSCTCADTDPRLCPNYVAGDEEGDYSDDDSDPA